MQVSEGVDWLLITLFLSVLGKGHDRLRKLEVKEGRTRVWRVYVRGMCSICAVFCNGEIASINLFVILTIVTFLHS